MEQASLSGWGRYPVFPGEESFPGYLSEVPDCARGAYLPRGMGRSYGDAGLPAPGHAAVNGACLDRFIAFDPDTGVLEAEAGITLDRILAALAPRGWFLPVTPGTRFVSLGGAIASNVHGKNHHRCGSLEHFLESVEVLTPQGPRVCSPAAEGGLFRATVGGYGLTGFITRARLRLKRVASDRVDVLRLRAGSLAALFDLFARHDAAYEYSVAWLDTLAKGPAALGRGVLMLGNHAPARSEDAPSATSAARRGPALRVPAPLPDFLMSPALLAAWNRCFYWAGPRGESRGEDFAHFFYPLDRIGSWNLLYGRAGFLQYQCAVPDPQGEDGIAACLAFLAEHGLGSFLSVLKRCGDDEPLLPFCKRGYTLALDIPFRGERTLSLLDRLDAIVMDHGGRVYLTKDARLKPEAFRAMYPEWRAFMDEVRRWNPEGRVRSRMAERLGLWS